MRKLTSFNSKYLFLRREYFSAVSRLVGFCGELSFGGGGAIEEEEGGRLSMGRRER